VKETTLWLLNFETDLLLILGMICPDPNPKITISFFSRIQKIALQRPFRNPTPNLGLRIGKDSLTDLTEPNIFLPGGTRHWFEVDL